MRLYWHHTLIIFLSSVTRLIFFGQAKSECISVYFLTNVALNNISSVDVKHWGFSFVSYKIYIQV